MAADYDSQATPLSHSHHQRYRRVARVRHSKQLQAFLTVQAARLGTTTAAVLVLLDSYTADQIKAVPNLGSLPPVGSH